jgi:hypothetical protein
MERKKQHDTEQEKERGEKAHHSDLEHRPPIHEPPNLKQNEHIVRSVLQAHG